MKSLTARMAGLVLPLVMVALVAFAPMAHAQDVAPTTVQTIYAGGISYNTGASPSIAGTGLYAHAISPDTAKGMYAFTAIDAVPNTLKPLTVNTNIGVGIAEKVATISGVDIFVPTAAGISFNGTNTGWQWSGGALAAFRIKGNYYLMPSVRFLKSSVSNGSGYQPIVGVLFGWGK